MTTKYRFYCVSPLPALVSTEVFPLDFINSRMLWEPEGDSIFLRKNLDKELVFINIPKLAITDYTYFKAIEDSADRCDDYEFQVHRSCDNGVTYSLWWTGSINVSDGSFDLDKCVFTVKPKVKDAYTCIINDQDKKFSLNSIATFGSTTAYIFDSYEFSVCRGAPGSCMLPAQGQWLLFHTETVEGNEVAIYYTEVTITANEGITPVAPSPGAPPWVRDTVAFFVPGFSRWYREPVAGTPSPNNPNPDVAAGNCDSGVASPPPRRQILEVDKLNTTPDPIILGKDVVGDTSVSPATEYYFVKYPKTNATYLWSITGTSNSITSGGSTAAVTVSIQNNGSVSVTETTSCGASTTVTQVFTVCSGSGCSSYNDDVEVIGSLVLCEGETGRYYLNAQTGRSPILLSSTTGTVLTNLGGGEFEIEAGDAGTLVVGWSGGGSTDSSTTPGISITIALRSSIDPIYGADEVCKTSRAYYSIPDSDIGSYNWVVTGGTIISGQSTNEILVEWDGSAGTGTVEVYQSFNCGNCNWIKIADCGTGTQPPYYWCITEVNTYANGRLLKSIAEYFFNNIACDLDSFNSDFFGWNPVGDAPGYVAGDNYVTGDANKLLYVSLHLKSDVLGVTPQIKPEITWKDFVTILRDVFQVEWFVDSSNRLRFEHISYFQRTAGIDLTDAAYEIYMSGTNRYKYDKQNMPKYERFSWQDASDIDFVGAEIRYDSSCVNTDQKSNERKNDVSKITTDLIFIDANESTISKEGFVLIANDIHPFSGPTYSVSVEPGVLSGISKPNAHLSWANLHYNYWRHNRVLGEGYMNVALTTFLSTQRTKIQPSVSFKYCCDDSLDTLTEYVETDLGNGVVDKAEFSIKEDLLTIDLSYE